MDRRVWKKSLVLMVGMLALAATTAWAAFEWENFTAILNGVDRNGNLTPVGASETNFMALENTSNGSVVGTARTRVWNQSNRFQVYVNNSDFGTIFCVQPTSSLYVVYPWGSASLVATGFENCPELEP